MQTPNDDKQQKAMRDYARYSGIGFQMIAIILLGVFGGIELDKLVMYKFPIFTLIFTLTGVGLSMYVVIKEFLK